MHFSEAVFLPRLLAHLLHIWLLRREPAESLLYNWTEIKEQKLMATGVAIVLALNASERQGGSLHLENVLCWCNCCVSKQGSIGFKV